MGSGRVDRRLVSLDVDGGNGREAERRERALGQRRLDEADHLFRRGAALAAHPGNQRSWPVDQVRGEIGAFARCDLDGTSRGNRVARLGQPRRVAFKCNGRAAKQSRHGGLCRFGIPQHPAFWRFVEAEGEARVGGCGERRDAAETGCDFASEPVSTVMAAEQRHDMRAVLRDGDHRRLVVLVVEEWREQADQNAGRTDADDRCAFAEAARQQRFGVFVLWSTGMDCAAGKDSDAGGRWLAGSGKSQDGGFHLPHASAPR